MKKKTRRRYLKTVPFILILFGFFPGLSLDLYSNQNPVGPSREKPTRLTYSDLVGKYKAYLMTGGDPEPVISMEFYRGGTFSWDFQDKWSYFSEGYDDDLWFYPISGNGTYVFHPVELTVSLDFQWSGDLQCLNYPSVHVYSIKFWTIPPHLKSYLDEYDYFRGGLYATAYACDEYGCEYVNEDFELTLEVENTDPVLSNGRVAPDQGYPFTDFYWFVHYYDPDGQDPKVKQVFIDSEPYDMNFYDGSTSNGTYVFGPLKLEEGDHIYYFDFKDGYGGEVELPESYDYQGPKVLRVNQNPVILSGRTWPDQGEMDTPFYWFMYYYDADGDPPVKKQVIINGQAHEMSLNSGNPSNGEYSFGPLYLPPGTHQFSFYVEDGFGGTYRYPQSGELKGPTVICQPVSALVQLTQYGDVWGAACHGVAPFDPPEQWGWPGFRYDPANHYYPLKADPDGDGDQDILQFTPYGDVWVSANYGSALGTPSRWGWPGFSYDEKGGRYPLCGDFNGDGREDIAQVTPYRDTWVALSSGSSFQAPVQWGWTGFSFSRGEPGHRGALPLSGDFNGDGMCDVAYVSIYTDAWVALSTGSGFAPSSRWGWPGFQYAPQDGYTLLSGDFTGDGKSDLLQLTPWGNVWVAVSSGWGFQAPASWGWPGFRYNEIQGLLPITGDVNADLKEDLIQITPTGDPWVSLSGGQEFGSPGRWGWLGYSWSREKRAICFFLGL